MDRFTFYHSLPALVQSAALSIYGIKLRRQRYGAPHDALLRGLLLSERLSSGELERLQTSRLTRVVHDAVNFTPYYAGIARIDPGAEITSSELQTLFPLLDKATVQAEGTRMIDTRPSNDRTVEIHTGGTTGRPLWIRASTRALKENYAFFERQKHWAGIAATSRVATFAGRPIVHPGQTHPPYWRDNWLFHQRLFSSYHIGTGSVDAYRDGLRTFQPDLIDSYPSSLEPIARRIIEVGDESIRPKAIITSSETLSDSTRQLLKTAFACGVYDHYGSAEMVAFVTQCEHESYHVNSEYGTLELLDDTGQPVREGAVGEVVATGFINEMMPLIRYRMGDLASWVDGQCKCGRAFPRLQRILGRIDDVVITADGRRIGRLDPIFKSVTSLHEAKIIQTSPTNIIVEMVVSDAFSQREEDTLRRELEVRLGNTMTLMFQKVEQLPRTASGKLRQVERRF